MTTLSLLQTEKSGSLKKSSIELIAYGLKIGNLIAIIDGYITKRRN